MKLDNPLCLSLYILKVLYTKYHFLWRSFTHVLSGGIVNGFLIIRNSSFYNHLMHELLVVKAYDFLYINLLEHVD